MDNSLVHCPANTIAWCPQSVLILVVMDNSLVPGLDELNADAWKVLILVVMDNSLVHLKHAWRI